MEFLRNVTLGQYVPGTSIVHRLDPRVKLGVLLIGMTVVFSCQHLVPLALFAVLCVLAAVPARIPVPYFLGGLRSVVLLVSVTLVFNALFVQGGTPLLRVGPVTLGSEGLHVALLMSARLVLLYLMTSLFTLTTSPIRLTDALESVLYPLRLVGLRTAELSMMVSIALRFIPTLVETTEKIMKAQLSRGARFNEGSTLSRTRALLPVLVPLFIQAFHAADALAEAMEARCYRGGAGRTRLVTLAAGAVDLGAVVVAGAAGMAVLCLDFLPWRGWT